MEDITDPVYREEDTRSTSFTFTETDKGKIREKEEKENISEHFGVTIIDSDYQIVHNKIKYQGLYKKSSNFLNFFGLA